MKMQRSAGILLPVSSLPSPYGIGCFSQEAYDFVDWLKEAGQTYWQILPLGVTSYGDSPYQSFSAFAGNPYFISLDALVEEGVLTAAECKKANFGRKADDIDYSRLYAERGRLLRLAYSRSDIGHNEAFTAFCEKNKWWLDDFALFMAVKGRFEGKPWIEWAEDIRLRWQPAMDYYRRELYFEVEYHKYLQFKFDQQWRRLKAYANSKGIRIIGDIPIYVALDSADAWANPGLFQLDKDNIPTAVAGVPRMAFRPPASSGAIRSTAGKHTAQPAISGGSPACGTASSFTMWCASTTSAASMSIFPSPTAARLPRRATGKKAPASSCSVLWSRHWANGRSLRRILAT